ncbi:tetratricopeptide repeat protein [Microbulbifer yueqingensis]|uniref:Tetratricopeptide repeat-containing protein n=1 Tax=Microbulbifer yueqingensis TaxID=658219 RepID=A0A1G9CWX8_9GAMM|nr:tetratricopeptide repeat protein [Microbulbifer yueqingensis]SDK56123.1 Tetratricopeptide repeat-containing protein [Microbulbifer yueqingensis]
MKRNLKWLALVAGLAVPQVLFAGEFAGGIEAFRSGDYKRALQLFEQAHSAGNNSSRLKYNLGVTLVKLGRYREASEYFYPLLSQPEWRDLARYNLALAAERQGSDLQAARHYRQVTASADSEKLRKLAGKRLRALAVADAGRHAKRGLGLVSLSAGYDDNAYALQNDLLEDVDTGDDSFSEAFAWGQYRLRGTPADGWRIYGYGFTRRYSELDSLNLASVSAGLVRDDRWRGWNTELGAATEFISLGGEEVTRQLQLLGRLKRTLGPGLLSLSYIPAYYVGGDEYSYLDGWRQRFGVKWRQPALGGELLAFYLYDNNDRADLVRQASDYYSYSPARHSVGTEVEWAPASRWTVATGVEFRQSVYAGTNLVTAEDGSVLRYQRESDRIKSWLSTKFRFTPRFSLDGKVVNIDNQENRELYTFDKSEISFGVSYIF